MCEVYTDYDEQTKKQRQCGKKVFWKKFVGDRWILLCARHARMTYELEHESSPFDDEELANPPQVD